MMIAVAAILTVVIEAAFLFITVRVSTVRGGGAFAAAVVLANLATNLTLQLVVLILARFAGLKGIMWLIIYPLEALAVFAEYGIYRSVLTPSKWLLLLTLIANAVSYCVGALLFGHI
jgi:hypothetical protein